MAPGSWLGSRRARRSLAPVFLFGWRKLEAQRIETHDLQFRALVRDHQFAKHQLARVQLDPSVIGHQCLHACLLTGSLLASLKPSATPSPRFGRRTRRAAQAGLMPSPLVSKAPGPKPRPRERTSGSLV